jgi:hypothetical protein
MRAQSLLFVAANRHRPGRPVMISHPEFSISDENAEPGDQLLPLSVAQCPSFHRGHRLVLNNQIRASISVN